MPITALASDGLSIACLHLPPDWSGGLSVSHRFAASIVSGESGREGRRPEAEELTLTAAVRLSLESADAAALRESLAALAGGWVGVPLWPDALPALEWKSSRIYDAERLDVYDPATGIPSGIVARATVLGLSDPSFVSIYGGLMLAPLLVGHIDDLPPITPLDDENGDLVFTVTEDSPWAFRIGINATGTVGTWPATLSPDWSSPPTDAGEHGVKFGRIGETRERTIDGLERAFRWKQEAEFWLTDRTECRTLLAFFVASQGPRKSFASPVWFNPGTPTAATPENTTMRFEDDVLTLDYFTDSDATARVRLTQVPWEIAGVGGETPAQAPRVFLYKITHALPTPQIYRFTNWRRALARTADGTYTPAPFKHREITESLDLRNNTVAIDSFLFTGNPLTLFHPFALEGKMLLTIYEVETDPIDPDAAVMRWIGEIKSTQPNGRKITAAAVFFGGLLEQKIPRVLIGPRCNTRLFSAKCGLVKATFDKTGTFTSAAGCVLTIATAAADAANTFVHGSIEIGAGAAWEVREIIASAPTGGGQLITVDWPFRQAAAGQAVLFARGCDLTGATCRTLGPAGSWKDRFRGHEHVPTDNYSLPKMQPLATGGKK